ncbi:DctP family TRAP transporter solute-binding subunit [Escherichia coli]|nr:DctP family TRAP transporter solute-binding subunit [Escherichia coli]
MTILIFIVSLLGAIAIGVPIAWALLLCGISLMFWMDIFDVQILAQTLVNGADSFSLLAIPFFVLAGEIMNAGGLSQRIVDLPMKLVGHRPGGLGYVGVLAAMISGVRGGTIDMEMSGSNNFTGLSPVINLLDVPFLFRDTAHAHKTLDGKVGDDLKVSLEGKGLKVLAYWENGWRDVTNSRAPVKTPADLKGLKIRTNNSPMNIAAFKVFGANPIPMPFAEVYTGLETRTIDAQEHPINVVWSAKFYEVQKYLSLTHHAYSPLLVVINKAKFDGLTPEFQQALISSAQEAGSYQRKLVAEDQQKIIDGMKEAGVEVITDLDRKAFSDALGTQVRDMFVKDVPQGADLLKAVDEVQ